MAINMCWAMTLPPLYSCFSFVIRNRLFRMVTLNSGNSDENSTKINPQTNSKVQKVVNDLISEEIAESSHSLKEQFTKKQKRLLKIYKFLLSTKFLLVGQAILFCLHSLLWLIVGMLEIFGPSNFSDVYLSMGFDHFESGCKIRPNTMTLYISLYSFYGFITLVFLILVFIGEKDTWGIKMETSITTSLMLVCVILSFSLPRVSVLTNLVDYIFPLPMILSIYSIGQFIILITIPTIRAINQDRKQKMQNGEAPCLYEKLLSERESFNLILDYSRRSYSSEPVLCFETIENYRKSRRMTVRMKTANNILENFLSKSSPLELNIPKIDNLHQDLLLFIKEKNETKIDELLEQLRVHCLLDMNEMMTRMNSEYPKMFLKAKQELTSPTQVK